MKNMKRRILGFILSISLVLGLMPELGMTAYAAGSLVLQLSDDLALAEAPYTYYASNDGDKSIDDGTYVQINMGTWHTNTMSIYFNGEVVYTKPSGAPTFRNP